jgi:O-antigen ligase
MGPGLTRFALAFALAALPLAFSARQAAVYTLPKLLALSAAAFLAWVGLALSRARVRRTPLDAPLAALALATALSTFLSCDPLMSLLGHYRAYFYGDLSLLLVAALFYAAASSSEGSSPENLLRVGVGAAALCGAYAVMQRAGIELAVGVQELEAGQRAFSTLGNPVYLGSCLQLFVPLALCFALDGRGSDRALGVVSLLGLAAGLFLSLSRGAWLSACVGACAYLFWTGRLPLPRSRKACAAFAAAVLLAAAGYGLASRLRPTAVSDSARLHLWASAVRVVSLHPWSGTGPDTFEPALRAHRTLGFLRALGQQRGQADAHNDILQAAATLGLPGLAAYLWAFWGLWLIVRRASPGPCAAGMAAALIGLFVQAKLNPTPLASLGCAAVLAGLLASSSKKEPEPEGRRSLIAPAAVLLLAVMLLGVVRLCRADYRQKRALLLASFGRAEEAGRDFKTAQRLNPFCLHYRFAYAQRLLARARGESDPAARIRLLDECVREGREALRRHPNQVDAAQILGAALLMRGQAGSAESLMEAQAVLDGAQGLDPYFLPLLNNRITAARALGESGKLDKLESKKRWILENSGG